MADSTSSNPAPGNAASAEASSTEASSARASSARASSGEVSSASLDAQAYTDGAAGISREPSETILAHQVARAHVQRLQDDVRDRLNALSEQVDAVRSQRKAIVETEARLEQMEEQHASTARRLSTSENRLEATEEAQAAKKARGSLFYAGLYSLAGTLFIAGDVIMSREIVANALKLQGDVEPWVFAIGLAMLAILLKPAYDRLVETPYWNGRPGIFAGVIGVCGAGALATLWILGAFRSTAFVSNARIQRLTAELMQASDPAAIGEIQAQIGSIQQGLIESPLGYWAFVVSGVLFAVAGAVCLGIGIRHGRDAYHIRYRLHRARRRFQAACDEQRTTLAELEDAMAEHHVRLRRQQQVLDDMPTLDALAEQRAALRERETLLRDQEADLHSRALHARYQHGYARGQADGPSASLAESGDGMTDALPASDAPPQVSPTQNGRSTPRSSPRPYQALREWLLRNAS
jgi:hypothetical protein